MPRATSPSPRGSPTSTASTCASPDLSVGTYCIPVGGKDGQQPHREDEIYVVVRGHGRLTTDTCDVAIGPGSVIYVPACEYHQFTEISDDLSVVVVFAPAERTRE